MKWEIRKVYLYLVSLITFIMLLVGTWGFIIGVLEVAYPEPAADPCLEAIQSPEKAERISDPAKCAEAKAHVAEITRVRRIRELISNVLFLVIVGPAYWYHWRQARRSETA